MENLLFLGVPILKHITVCFYADVTKFIPNYQQIHVISLFFYAFQ